MAKKPPGLYHFFIVLPNRCYPFRNQVEGQWVRGMRSAEVELRRAGRRYGVGAYGYKFATYRQLFHLIGSLIVIYGAAFLAYHFFNSATVLVIVLVVVTLLITYQEFFYQRRHYRQHWQKAVADWLTWCAPIGLYIFFK